MNFLIFLIQILLFSNTVSLNNSGTLSDFGSDNSSEDNFFLRTWTMDDGLPVNAVNDINQCDLGYLWLSTYDGIVRFDGLNFTIFNTSNTPEFKNNRFFDIKKSSDGALWFYNEFKGIVRYYNGQFKNYDASNSFTDGGITHFFEHNGSLIITTSSGVFSYYNEQFKQIIKRNTTSQNFFTSGLATPSNHLFFSSHDGIIEITPDDETLIHRLETNLESSFIDITFFNNSIYATTKNTVYKLNSERNFIPIDLPEDVFEKIFVVENHLIVSGFNATYLIDSDLNYSIFQISDVISNHIYRILETDDYNNTYTHLVSSSGKLITYRDGSLYLNKNEYIQNLIISALFTDNAGTQWYTSNNFGLHQVLKKHVSTITLGNDTIGNNIIAIYLDNSNNLWVSPRMRGLAKITSDNEIKHINKNSNDEHIIDVHSFSESSNGDIWFVNSATLSLARIAGNLITEYRINELIPSRLIRAAAMNSDDTIWIGGNGVIVLFDTVSEQKIKVYNRASGLPESSITKIIPTSNNSFWASTTSSGILFYENGIFANYTTSDGLGSNSVRGIYVDRYDQDTIWFATEGNGLTRFKNGEMHVINTSHGLFDDLLHNVIEDHFGRLWMSTNRGIFYVYKDNINQFINGEVNSIVSIFFNTRHGMLNAEGNGGFQNSFIFKDHTLYYPTQHGIAIIQTDKLDIDSNVPSTIIQNVQSNIVSIDPNVSEVVFEKGTRDLKINFTAIEFINPERIRFRYKLVGYDRDWIDAGSERMAVYTNLPPRTYTFKVKTSGINQRFPDEFTSANITLLPYFYQQSWFMLLSIALFLGILILSHKYRIRYLEQKEVRLLNLVENRTSHIQTQNQELLERQQIIEKQKSELESANKTKDAFFSIIAHDLKGPIGGIYGLSNLMLEDFNTSSQDEIKQYLTVIKDSSYGTQRLLANLLDWARIQSGKMHTEFETLDAEKLVLSVLQSQTSVIKHKKIQLKLELNEEFSIYADKNLMETVLRNLISNAIKFSYTGKTVSVSTRRASKSMICFEIKDQGMGMSKTDVENALRIDRSFSKKGTMNESGSGLGLTLCINMVNLMNGKLEIDSEIGNGTTIKVFIPSIQTPEMIRVS